MVGHSIQWIVQSFFNMLKKINKPPSRKQLANKVLDKAYAACVAQGNAAFSAAFCNHLKLTVTTDSATIDKHQLTNYLAHVPDYDVVFMNYDDATEHYQDGDLKNKEYVFDGLCNTIDELGPSNDSSWQMIEEKYSSIFCIGCLPHQVNTFVKHVCKRKHEDDVNDIAFEASDGYDIRDDGEDCFAPVCKLIAKCKLITSHFNNIHANKAIMSQMSTRYLQFDNAFICPAYTRFGLYLLMMHCILIL